VGGGEVGMGEYVESEISEKKLRILRILFRNSVLHEQSSEPEFRLFMFKKLQLIFLT
jgi:hypothetical protein